MNRFNQSPWSKVQCEMILAFLSFAEYFRPRFFLLENVRNFVSFNKGQTFRLTLASLLEIGYQVLLDTCSSLSVLNCALLPSLPCVQNPVCIFIGSIRNSRGRCLRRRTVQKRGLHLGCRAWGDSSLLA